MIPMLILIYDKKKCSIRVGIPIITVPNLECKVYTIKDATKTNTLITRLIIGAAYSGRNRRRRQKKKESLPTNYQRFYEFLENSI